jgi:hypothetical protein
VAPPWIILLIALGAILPIVAFARLLWRAQRAASSIPAMKPAPTKGEVAGLWYFIRRDLPVRERNAVIWDICLVGVGLLSGAAANIWSLYV